MTQKELRDAARKAFAEGVAVELAKIKAREAAVAAVPQEKP